MRKLTLKIMLALFLVLLISSFIPRLWVQLFSRELPNKEIIGSNIFAYGMIFTAFMTLLLFTTAINYLIVMRVHSLSEAAKDIAGGNYDIHLPVEGQDEISELTSSFNKMSQELKANEYLSKEFARNFSHELKTPLSIIKGYAELMDSSISDAKEIEEYRQIIIRETERLSALSKTMLQMSILDTTTIVIKEDVYNVTEQIREVLQFMQLEYEDKQLELVLKVEEITIKSNQELTHQIWVNLISNAIRFSHPKTKILLSLQKEDDQSLVFSITNQGVEIPKEQQKKIFQLFYVVDQSRHEQSSGVGLSLTKKIVDKLGGQITVKSKEEETTFQVKIPTT
jgi:signal transduction histidine kinase